MNQNFKNMVEAVAKCDEVGLTQALDVLAIKRREREEAIENSGLANVLKTVQAEIAIVTINVDEEIEALTKAIKDRVVEFGSTVKGASLMAVYSKGRESWNSKWLHNYATDHPEVLAALDKGKPSVSIRG